MKTKLTKRRSGGGGGATPVESIPEWMRPSIEKVTGQAETQFNSGNLSQVAGQSNLQNRAFGGGANAVTIAGARGLDTLQGQQNRATELASTGIDTSTATGLIGDASQNLMGQSQRLANMATTPSADVLAAQKQNIILDAQKRVAGMDTQFGGAGTLGSARQAVMQGAQNAATTGELAKVDADYENKMFQNRLAAEQALGNTSSGLINAATATNATNTNDFNSKLAAEQLLGTSVGSSGSMATGTAKTLADLGSQERGINQAQADSGWQGLQRYASTVFGNPARQSAVAGGK